MKIINTLAISIALGLTSQTVTAAYDEVYELAIQEYAQAKVNFQNNPNLKNEAIMQAAKRQMQSLAPDFEGRVHTRAQVGETEPNGTVATADALGNVDSGTGTISPIGDVDFWSISGASAGDVVFVTIDTEFSAALDTQLTVLANDGTTTIETDDESGDGLASAVVAVVPQAGNVFFRFIETGNNAVIDPYEVFQAVLDPADTVNETEPNDSTATASPASSSINVGDISGGADFFQFEATAGDRLAVIVDSDPNQNGTLSDILINILDTDGITSLGQEAPFTLTAQNTEVFTAVNTGTHFIQLSGGGTDTDYRFVIAGSSGTVPVELQSFSIE